jgi:hypothetical protein
LGFGILDLGFWISYYLVFWNFGILAFCYFGILELWYFGILSIKKTADLQPTTKLTANNDKGNQ